ncbi:MAG TPA: LacI family DNA-binding transcriptional regulator [Bryobacteraceae bacterium]|nr:LacI family DNA-binding transcriptional regulator [Bryobacteraceae bacterium]
MKRIGIPEIAKLANVTIGTVDRALHGRPGISESTRQRVLEIARNVGYQPNLAARALSVRRRPIRIGVSIPREIHYHFDQLQQGIKAEAQRAELLGVETIWAQTDRLGAAEPEKVAELLRNEPRALILTPGNPQQLIPVINEAERRNIRVICVDTDAPASIRSSAVCVNATVSGRVAAELLGAMIPAGSSVAVVTGMLHIEDHSKKAEGFQEAFPQFCQGGRVAEIVEGHEDEDEAFQKCFALLERNESLAGMYVNTANCLPVCRAIGALGLAGRFKLITTDLFDEMRPYFEKGTISASISSRPYVQGELAMRLVVDHLVNGAVLPKAHYLAPQVVMRSTFHLFREMRQAVLAPAPASVAR